MKLIQKIVFLLLIGVTLMSQGGRFLLNDAHADGKPTKEGGGPHPREGGASCG